MRFLKRLIRRLGGNEADGLEYKILGVIIFLILVVIGRIAIYALSQHSFDLLNSIK